MFLMPPANKYSCSLEAPTLLCPLGHESMNSTGMSKKCNHQVGQGSPPTFVLSPADNTLQQRHVFSHKPVCHKNAVHCSAFALFNSILERYLMVFFLNVEFMQVIFTLKMKFQQFQFMWPVNTRPCIVYMQRPYDLKK